MDAGELIDLAAQVASCGPALIVSPGRMSDAGLEEYWSASKRRLDRWTHTLRAYQREAEQEGAGWARDQWPQIAPTMAEVLAGEVLARVWTAVVCGYDRHRGESHAEPVARSILVGQMEARNQVLRLMVGGPSPGGRKMIPLNQLRQRCERWSDLLIGYLLEVHDVSELACDPGRAREFAESLADERQKGLASASWQLTLGALRPAFRQLLPSPSAYANLNQQVAASILACFPPELFDAPGVPQSFWLTRLLANASDAQGMIEELLTLEETPRDQSPGQLR